MVMAAASFAFLATFANAGTRRSGGSRFDRSDRRIAIRGSMGGGGSGLTVGRRRHRTLEGSAPTPSPSAAGGGQCYAPTDGTHDPSSRDYYDVLYSYIKSVRYADSSRIGSVEVVPPLTSPPSPVKTDRKYALLPVVSILGFSASTLDENGDQTLVIRGNGGIQSFGDSSGLLMAIHHFNNGVGTVVKEVEGIHNKCNVRFVADNFYDSESSQVTAVDIFSRMLINDPERPPGALFGAWRSAVSVPLGILSGVYAVPQISPLSTSTELDDTSQYRYFSRLIPSDSGTAIATVDYLKSRLNLEYLGLIYVNDAYGSAFNLAMGKAAVNEMTIKHYPFSYNNNLDEDAQEIEMAIRQLAESKYKVFFGVFYDEHYELIMEAAYRYGIVGPGYVWIVSDGLSESYLNNLSYEKGSPLAIASQGIGILKAVGGRETEEGTTGFDRFAKAWYGQDNEAVDYFNCKQPLDNTIRDPSIYYRADGDFFESKKLTPTAGAVFVYDSIMAMGLAACQLAETNRDDYFDGSELFEGFVSQSFEGASGLVNIDPATTSRDPKSAFFVLYNSYGTTEGESTTFIVHPVSHTIRNPDESSTKVFWVDIEGRQYTYSDGTSTPPLTLPPIEGEDLNQLSAGERGTGLALAAIVFVLSLFFGFCTRRYRRNRVVKASQPIFLQMICVGTFVMGCTIITLSIDDGIASQHGCDIACMLSPWFFTYGFVIAFSALFSKTWRINKIFRNPQMRRIKVTLRDVILPFFVLLALNTIVLAVWTAASPLQWHRKERGSVDEFGRSLESYGLCTGEGLDYVPYETTLLIINVAVLILANYQAYHARTITTEYSESKYIGIIMASMLQATCIGLPLIILVSDEPAASFFVKTGIIFVTCVSMLLLIFVPKVLFYKKHKKKVAAKKKAKEDRAAARLKSMKEASLASERMKALEERLRIPTSITRPLSESSVSKLSLHDPTSFVVNLSHEEEAVEEEEWSGGKANNLDDRMKPESLEEGSSKEIMFADEQSRMDGEEELAQHRRASFFSDMDTDDASSVGSIGGNDGIKITNHPKSESQQLIMLKAQVDHMKHEKVRMQDHIDTLTKLLTNNGIEAEQFLHQSFHCRPDRPELAASDTAVVHHQSLSRRWSPPVDFKSSISKISKRSIFGSSSSASNDAGKASTRNGRSSETKTVETARDSILSSFKSSTKELRYDEEVSLPVPQSSLNHPHIEEAAHNSLLIHPHDLTFIKEEPNSDSGSEADSHTGSEAERH